MKLTKKGNDRRYYEKHKEKIKKYVKEWEESNKEHISKRKRQYYQKNKEVIKKRVNEYYYDNKESIKISRKEYRRKNKKEINRKNIVNVRLRQTRKRQAVPPWYEHDSVMTLYDEAQRITEETGVIHHVDHIVPLKSNLVCGLHCIDNLQIIPATENLSKSNKFVIS